MEALVTIYPNLDTDLSKRHQVKILSYSQESTMIIIEGDGKNVQKARQEIQKLISNFTMVDVQFEHPILLLESARKRIKEGGFKVCIKAPTATPKAKSKPMCVKVSSFLPQQLQKVTAILEGNPTYKSLKIPSDVIVESAKLRRIPAAVSKEHQVSVRCIYKNGKCTSVLIWGFVKNDLALAHTILKEKLFTINMTVPKAPAQHMTVTYAKQEKFKFPLSVRHNYYIPNILHVCTITHLFSPYIGYKTRLC